MEILNIEGESLVSTNKETIHIPEGVTPVSYTHLTLPTNSRV